MATRRLQEARQLMQGFASRTGLTSERPPRRYLWTDAFAVCNYLGLWRATGQARFMDQALGLIEQVHSVLGRHRPDSPESGWLSGLGEVEGRTHPTRGGLRIGKPLPERGLSEPHDERLEWDRDGQYFHYLTRWMRSLDLTSSATGDPRFNLWARELAAAAHEAFVVRMRGGQLRMHWKMSTDLRRPLVASMGHHDPLDGYVTCAGLIATASRLGARTGGPALQRELASFARMIQGRDFATSDPLGLGGLLLDAHGLSTLKSAGAPPSGSLVDELLEATVRGLAGYARSGELEEPARHRLAFRELGLAIGLAAVPLIEQELASPGRHMATLVDNVPVGERIVAFWLLPENQRTTRWLDHRDINEVMLATALVPDGCLSK